LTLTKQTIFVAKEHLALASPAVAVADALALGTAALGSGSLAIASGDLSLPSDMIFDGEDEIGSVLIFDSPDGCPCCFGEPKPTRITVRHIIEAYGIDVEADYVKTDDEGFCKWELETPLGPFEDGLWEGWISDEPPTINGPDCQWTWRQSGFLGYDYIHVWPYSVIPPSAGLGPLTPFVCPLTNYDQKQFAVFNSTMTANIAHTMVTALFYD